MEETKPPILTSVPEIQYSQRVGIVCNKDREGAEQWLERLLASIHETAPLARCLITDESAKLLGESNVLKTEPQFIDVFTSLEKLCAASEVIFTLGGDGTVLGAARAVFRSGSSAKLIGINLGKLGFIAENQPEEIPTIVRDLFAGNLLDEERLAVQAQVTSESNQESGVLMQRTWVEGMFAGTRHASITLVALNEIVVDNFGSTRMLTFELRVDGTLLGTMRADGIIIATPTGSTGYAVSAGGPIVEPTSPVLLIIPIAPHSLNVRPVIVPERVKISVRAFSDETMEALIVADGQDEVVVNIPALAEITAAPKKITLLRKKENTYFDRLRNKLLWSLDARDTRGLRR